MIIKKGEKIVINSCRKGIFLAEAYEDFDTEITEFYPVITCETVKGFSTVWYKGEKIPCRRGMSKILRKEM